MAVNHRPTRKPERRDHENDGGKGRHEFSDARNIAGNTVAIVAAALVPLVALIGSGVDMSRAYMVESRLQQACDAGVLAGRKEMGNSTWTTAAANVASEYFEVNYASDYLGSQDVSFVPTNPSGTTTVEGTASVRLPTVIMQFFTFSELNLAVDCAARYDVGNADVTFVLDTTGSMACPSDATATSITTVFRKGVAMAACPELREWAR